MSAPLYFLPKILAAGFAPAGRIAWSLVESRGLAAALADCAGLDDVARAEVLGAGPDGGPGLIVSPLPINSREPPRRLGFFPADQAWTRISDALWVGIDKYYPPSPADLIRKHPLPGHAIVLGDGQTWEVPILRRPQTGGPCLPADLFWDEAGVFVAELRPEYQALWAKTQRIADWFFGADDKGPTYQEAAELCLEALALNYRFGRPEQRVLRLVTTGNWSQILGAIVDLPWVEAEVKRLEEAEKKSAAGGVAAASSTPGAADSFPRIAPATENSTS